MSIFKRVINLIQKRNPLKYAKRIGVNIADNVRLVDNPDWGAEPFLISIGEHTLIAAQVAFINHDGATHVFREDGKYKGTFKFGTIRIGDNCFIGYRSIILPNVKIGDNCIVAAGSIVNKDIPSGQVWGGYQPDTL